MIKSKFNLGSQPINLELGWLLVSEELPNYGLDILTLFQENNKVLQTILLDDATMLKIAYFYADRETGIEWVEFLKELDSMDNGLEKFKEAFWNLVVGFSSPSVRGGLQKMWVEAKKQMKKNFDSLSSPSSQEQE